MHRKLWPRAPAKEGALGQKSRNFQIYFIHINFLRNQTKKIIIQPKRYTAMLLYLFLDSSLSTCPNKWKLKNSRRLHIPLLTSKMSADPRTDAHGKKRKNSLSDF